MFHVMQVMRNLVRNTTVGSVIRLSDLYLVLDVTQHYACAICKTPLTYTLFISVVRYTQPQTQVNKYT